MGEFVASKLGSKEHWDTLYKKEGDNFREFGDEGEVWFGEDSVQKMVDWCLHHVPPSTNPFCIDIGTGNGTLLFELVENGYNPAHLLGIDYSENSVILARSIASRRGHASVRFSTVDFLNEPVLRPDNDPASIATDPDHLWDIILDKGTYDAIALADSFPDGTKPVDCYPGRIRDTLKPGAYFLITSCNFTEDELKAVFTQEYTSLLFHSSVKHPTFSFGGKTGSTISTVAFQKM